MDKAIPFGRYLDDFEVGDVYHHLPGKTITESDNNLFCLLTMNHHPVHLDVPYAVRQQHGRILVVGTYVFSVVVGMTVRDISGVAIANLEYEQVTHLAPAYIGDTLHARSTVLDITPSSSKPDRGVVHIETTATNQDDGTVLKFRRKVLVPKRHG